MTDITSIPLFTTSDVAEANGAKHRTILEHIKKGRFPAPAIAFPTARGLFVWTEGQLVAAGFRVPKKASLRLNLA